MKNTSLKNKIIIGATALGFVALTLGLGVGISTSRISKQYSSEFVVSNQSKVIGNAYPDLATDLAQLNINQKASDLTSDQVVAMVQTKSFNLNSLVDFSKLEQKYPSLYFQVSPLENTASSETSVENVSVLAFNKETEKPVSIGSVLATISGFAQTQTNSTVNQSGIVKADLTLKPLASYGDLLPSQFNILIQSILASEINSIISAQTSQSDESVVANTTQISLNEDQLASALKNTIARIGSISFENKVQKLVYLATTSKIIAYKDPQNSQSQKSEIAVTFDDATGTASFKVQIIDAQNKTQNVIVNVNGLVSTNDIATKFKQEFVKQPFFTLKAEKRAELLNQQQSFYQLIKSQTSKDNLFSTWFDQKQKRFGNFDVTFSVVTPDKTASLDNNEQVSVNASLTYHNGIVLTPESLKLIDLPSNSDESQETKTMFKSPSIKVPILISNLLGDDNQKAFYDIVGSNSMLNIKKSSNFVTIFASDIQRVTNTLSDWSRYTAEHKQNIIDFFNNFATDVNKTIVTRTNSKTQQSSQDKTAKPVEVSDVQGEGNSQPQAVVKTQTLKAGDFLGQILDELVAKFTDLKVSGDFDKTSSIFKLIFSSQNEIIGDLEIGNVTANNVAYDQAKKDGVAYFFDARESLEDKTSKVFNLHSLNNNFVIFSDKETEIATPKQPAPKSTQAAKGATEGETKTPEKLTNSLTQDGLYLNNPLKYQGQDETATTLKDGVMYLAFEPTKDLQSGKRYNLLSSKIGNESGEVSVFIEKLSGTSDLPEPSSGQQHGGAAQQIDSKNFSDSFIIGLEYKNLKDETAQASSSHSPSVSGVVASSASVPFEILALVASNQFVNDANNSKISIKRAKVTSGADASEQIQLQDINATAIPVPQGGRSAVGSASTDASKRHITASSQGKFDKDFQGFFEDVNLPLLLEIVKTDNSLKFTLIPRTAVNNGESYISQTLTFDLKPAEAASTAGGGHIGSSTTTQSPTPSDKTIISRGLDFYQIGDTKTSNTDEKGSIIFKSFAVFNNKSLASDNDKIMKLRQSFVKQYLNFE